MKALVFKELKFVFCSTVGAFFALAFLLIMGAMLWVFSGNYNFIDGGYAYMRSFFSLAPILFAILIPALTMRLFSEEKRSKTLDILRARPVKTIEIYLSKFLATFAFVVATLLPTLIYVYSLYQLANPVGNIDIGSIWASYISLILFSAVFITVSLFGSVMTQNQVVALVVSAFLCLFSFYGFDLLSSYFLSGKVQTLISSIGLSYHYKLMQRGVIQLGDMMTIANYLFIFILATLFLLDKKAQRIHVYILSILCVLNLLFCIIPNVRVDCTADKRYTLSKYTIDILKQVGAKEKLEVNIYLNGELNYGFQHLKDATNQLLSDFNRYAGGSIVVNDINAQQYRKPVQEVYESMSLRGMDGIMLNEVDREGKASRKMIYPYAQVTNGKDTLVVSLLKNLAGNTAEENLNISEESLEFEFIDAIRLLNQEKEKTVAFIEGHDELSRVYVYDAEEILSKYYSVNRGQIVNRVGVLDGFDVIIISGPLKKYTESEKYIIDQYIMSGGKVLWMVDGVYYSHQGLAKEGRSASMKNDVNLDDMLFNYGVRINPDLIQDRQCLSTYIITDEKIQATTLLPSLFQPLLIPSPDHPITKNIRDVKAGFASSVDVVNNSSGVKKTVLLTTSANSHLVKVPDVIDFDVERIQSEPNYFNQQYIPVAISLEGKFNSVFANRMVPDSILGGDGKSKNQSVDTKMIVVSSSDIISNEIQGQGEQSQVLPMGYDRTSKQQFGNRDFIVNAVNWLADDNGLTDLRTKKQQLRMLNKQMAFENRDTYALVNTVMPIIFILLIIGGVFLLRKMKYEK